MQIRQKAPSRLIHCVTDVVASHWSFACDLTYFRHSRAPYKFEASLYQSEAIRATKKARSGLSRPKKPCFWQNQRNDQVHEYLLVYVRKITLWSKYICLTWLRTLGRVIAPKLQPHSVQCPDVILQGGARGRGR
jgi:hypothetical protein